MSTLKITIIVAASENNAIGKNNQMLWHLPDDFKYFKQQTIGHSVIMGRKTYESIGKPLPERRNIVVTRDQEWTAGDVDVANSISEILTYCRDEREIFIIGGADIYKQTLPLAQKVLLTRVHTQIDGDAYFPELAADTWKLVDKKEHPKDERHAYDFTFEVWERTA
ncbi:dihydrofolate reductase [Sphingobacterium allocomposti]|jgi:dihydrofolate reductase|uniref:Dihydrofolate reductase n=1 Tax=Sphingobacterium allocomposti TaxID=415956 RepID=A0A5S5DMV0_9SPHI|nr:dihydrofolate reductase [Sphingobacterium composti Yoo et al. 2007 non Ten et al. 2007]TYP96142.1 dihydrofolate reductase [Sphingobacterium composti Yoo et al. 2007 non Ten et al. 2007]HLS94959.1 dihydrofolate reductase [Sphingobacterium sp.]